MREPSWSLNMLAEVLSAFSVDEPNAMVNVVFRVAESVDAEVAAIIRDGKVVQSIGLVNSDIDVLLGSAKTKSEFVPIAGSLFYANWAPLGHGDYFVVGRMSVAFDLEERSLLRAMARSIELSSQVLMAMESERLASRMREELALADSIQKRMLCDADELSALTPELDVAARVLPSKEVGGDLYDWIPLGTHRYCFCIGDVAGKGVPAALVMSTCLSLLRAYVEVYDSPSAIMRRINQRLCHNNENCTFTTMVIGVIDGESGEMHYCNAGHNPPLVQRKAGFVQSLNKVHGPAVGILDGATYGEDRVVLEVGDSLLSYTDGASEAFNQVNQRYGVARLQGFVERHPVVDAKLFLNSLCEDLQSFSQGEASHDDTTLLLFRRIPPKQKLLSSDGTKISLQIDNDLSAVHSLSEQIKTYCLVNKVSMRTTRKLLVVIDDLLNNTITYGCKALASRAEIRLGAGNSRSLAGVRCRLVRWHSFRQGGEAGSEHPLIILLFGQDEVFRNDFGAIAAAGAQPQGVSQHRGGTTGLEACEAELVGHQKGFRKNVAQGRSYQIGFTPAIHLLEGRIQGQNDALVVRQHKRSIAVAELLNGWIVSHWGEPAEWT